ncbi:NAD(P)/FAD-dependent oxidoreductase [Marinobacter sp. 1Y8]
MTMNKSHTPPIRRVAIVGSGVAGLSAGRLLKSRNCDVTLFDKARGPGGRMASKRVTGGAVDIGAQYFTIRHPGFRDFLSQYAVDDNNQSCVEEWDARLRYQRDDNLWEPMRSAVRYVGVPRMSAITRALSRELDVHGSTRVERLESTANSQWRLFDTLGAELGVYDDVVIAAPPVQAETLLKTSGIELPGAGSVFISLPLEACWALIVHFPDGAQTEADGFSFNDTVLQWAANNSSKPGRQDNGEWWVLHAQADWSEQFQDADPDWVKGELLNAFANGLHRPELADDTSESITHRWLYAKTGFLGAGPGHLWSDNLRIGLCGDWLTAGRVEGAYISAEGLVESMVSCDQG